MILAIDITFTSKVTNVESKFLLTIHKYSNNNINMYKV